MILVVVDAGNEEDLEVDSPLSAVFLAESFEPVQVIGEGKAIGRAVQLLEGLFVRGVEARHDNVG